MPASTNAPLALAVRGLRKAYADVVAVDGLDLEVARRRVLRSARPQRRRQDDDDRDLRRTHSRPTPARSKCSACDGTRDERRAARRGSASSSRRRSSPKSSRWPRRCGCFRSFYPARPRASTRSSALVQLGREARRARRKAVRRAEAAARAGVRARRRSRAALPRRADDRTRSAIAPAALGSHRRVSRRAAGRSCSRRTTWTRRSGCAIAWRSWITDA